MRALLFLTAAVLAGPAAAADRLTVLLDWFVNPNHGPLVVAQEQGWFAEAGLEVELIAPSDPAAPPRLVAASLADLAVSYQPQLHLQVHEGLPLVRVGTLIATPLNCLLVLRDGPVATPADLAGRRIGYSVAGVEEALLTAVLGRHGVRLDEVTLINVNFALSPALMSGQVDAVIGAFRNFEVHQMDIEGRPGRCFFLEEEGAPPYDELIFVAHAQNLDRGRIARFLEVVERATQFIVNHPEAAWEIFADSAPELRDDLNGRAWTATIPRFALRPAALDHGRYARFERFLVDRGLAPAETPVGRLAIDATAPAAP